MKKLICVILAICLVFALAACGGNAQEADSALSGTVSTDGSTSMEKVIGGLG